MKKEIFGLLILFFWSCTIPDEIEMGSRDLKIDNLIQIETLPNYKVNDVLYINSSFSRYMPEEGYTIPLDIYKTSKSEQFYFYCFLEKQTSNNNWDRIDLGKRLQVTKGSFEESLNGFSALCVLDPITNLYEFRGGIQLMESGNYRIHINQTLLPKYSDKSIVYLNIITTISQMGTKNGLYNFTVN
jgi:hypothetical protein